MKNILIINGPNLNRLGKRNNKIYGNETIQTIEKRLKESVSGSSINLLFFQSNSSGAIIDRIQKTEDERVDAIIINPGALTHYDLSLRDAIEELHVPVIEVHISNIHARESWRSVSVILEVCAGQISGFGWQSYRLAILYLKSLFEREEPDDATKN